MKTAPQKTSHAFQKVAAQIPFTAARAKAKAYRRFIKETAAFNFDKMKVLIEKYPDAVDWKTSYGSTALYPACIQGNEDFLVYLLDHGAKTDTLDQFNDTPLHYAAHAGFLKAVISLLAHSAPIDAQNSDGETPLMRAVEGYHPKESVEALLAAGANPCLVNKKGETARNIAVAAATACAQVYKKERAADLQETAALLKAVEPEYRRKRKERNKKAAMAVFTDGLPKDLRTKRLKLKIKPPAA